MRRCSWELECPVYIRFGSCCVKLHHVPNTTPDLQCGKPAAFHGLLGTLQLCLSRQAPPHKLALRQHCCILSRDAARKSDDHSVMSRCGVSSSGTRSLVSPNHIVYQATTSRPSPKGWRDAEKTIQSPAAACLSGSGWPRPPGGAPTPSQWPTGSEAWLSRGGPGGFPGPRGPWGRPGQDLVHAIGPYAGALPHRAAVWASKPAVASECEDFRWDVEKAVAMLEGHYRCD